MPPSTSGLTEMSPPQTGGFPDHTDKSGTPFPACPLSKALDQSTASLIYFILLGASVDWVLLLLFCALGALMRPSRSTASSCVSGDHDVLLDGSPASMNVRHLDRLPSRENLWKEWQRANALSAALHPAVARPHLSSFQPLAFCPRGLKALSQS